MASIDKVHNGYKARWREPGGGSRAQTFRRKADALRHIAGIEGAKLTGSYVDAAAGRTTFGDLARSWQASLPHRPSTAALIEGALRLRILPTFGHRPIASIRPSEVQAWVRGLSDDLAPSTTKVLLRHLRAIFAAAVRDRLIVHSPAVSIALPRQIPARIEPLSTEEVLALIEALPDRFKVLGVLGAGLGRRQGEAAGLTVDRVDFLRRQVTIDRQLVTPSAAATS